MKLVLNATPLIHLTRAGLDRVFAMLRDTGAEVFTAPAVLDEIKKGWWTSDAGVIADLIDRWVVEVREPEDKEFLDFLVKISAMKMLPLHEGEAEVLAIAREMEAIAVVDEKAGRMVGRVAGVEVHGTVYLLILLYRKGKVSRKGVVEGFKSMVKTGYRISPKDYELIMEELERI